MRIIPAIDLLGGKAVRLRQGRREDATVYSERPWELARSFADAGAERIHVVDLDGAFGASPAQRPIIERILAESQVPVEVGGGIRDMAAVDAAFASGVSFVVLGTAAAKNPAFAEAACRKHPGKIVVAVDARDGLVAVEGWTEVSEIVASDLASQAADWGAGAVLYTDISRDGMKTGANVEATRTLAENLADRIPVIASGGIGSLEDIRQLAAAGVPMAVVGRALYDGRFELAAAIAAAREAMPC